MSVRREGRRWYVVVTAERDGPEPLPATGSAGGVGLGIAHFLADSDGGFVPSPRQGEPAHILRAGLVRREAPSA